MVFSMKQTIQRAWGYPHDYGPPICSHTLHIYFPSTDPFAWPSQWPRLEELLAKQVSSQSHLEATTLCLLAWQGMEWGCNTMAGWWFQTFFIFHNIWDNPSHWLIFLKMIKTTIQWWFPVVFCVEPIPDFPLVPWDPQVTRCTSHWRGRTMVLLRA